MRAGRLLLVPLLAVAAIVASPSSAADEIAFLTYLPSSTGLDEPALEGGDTELELGDVNEDGHLDLVSVGDHGNPLVNSDQEGILVWFGDGQGSWTHARFGHLGYGGVALGDVNEDGHLDVAYGIHHDYSSTDLGDQLLEVALGDGSGAFWTPWDDGLADEGQSWGMFATDLGDVDGDGDLDVGSTGFGSMDGFHVYLNRGDGTWDRSFGFLAGNSDHVFQFGDVDGDGHLDVATAKQEATVWIGDGEGFFTAADGNLPPLASEWAWRPGPSLGDVDGDGRDDLAYCDEDDHPRVWLARGPGAWHDATADLPLLGTCEFTALADMDGDGRTDLAVFGNREVRVFAGDGAGSSWTEIASFVLPVSPGRGKAFRVGGDFDHNGKADIVLVADRQVDLFNTRNELMAYREASVPAVPAIRVTGPGPNRTLLAGAMTFLEWVETLPAGETGTVDLEWSDAGATGPWTSIATGLATGGRLQWEVPDLAGRALWIRAVLHATSASVEDVSDGPFHVARRPDAIAVAFASRDHLRWTDALGRARFNAYRGSWARFEAAGEYTQDPAEVPDAARYCGLEAAEVADAGEPGPGGMYFYLVTGFRLVEDGQEPGVAVPMAEGALGQRSGAAMRTNARPCSSAM